MGRPTVTEAQIMRMKKDELKEIIFKNGFGSFYKSTMLKADMQIVALKSVGLAADKDFPTPRGTPAKTPRTRRTAADAVEEAKAVPLPASFDTAKPDPEETPRRRSIRQALKSGIPIESFPVDPVTPAPATTEDDAEDEEPSARPSMDSKTWEMVDALFIVMLVVLVIAVFVGYAMSDPYVKEAVTSQWGKLRGVLLTRLSDAKGGL